MIEMHVEIQENAEGKTVTTIHAARENATVKEELQANDIVQSIAESMAKTAGDGSTMVHRPLPSA